MVTFYVAEELPKDATFPAALLEPRDWDDYGYQTEFLLRVSASSSHLPVDVGKVKVLARRFDSVSDDDSFSRRRTENELPKFFNELESDHFCSLGQTSNYYANLRALDTDYDGYPPGIGLSIARSLADVTALGDPASAWWQNNVGFTNSLIRYPAANIARKHGRLVLEGRDVNDHVVNAIPFGKSALGVRPTSVQLMFNGELPIPGRINVLVGRNGAGKTRLLGNTAYWLTEELPRDTKIRETYKPTFSKVIYVSLNSFDETDLSYRRRTTQALDFVGIRPGSKDRLQALHAQLAQVPEDQWSEQIGSIIPSANFLATLLPDTNDHLQRDLAALQTIPAWIEFASRAFESPLSESLVAGPMEAIDGMSAGQRALASLYAGLFRRLDKQSLVLIDEPENFLHPSLIARFVRSLNDLLDDRKAFALLATHSPIVVQETPSKFVWVVERDDEETVLTRPSFETFGESIDNLDEYLFETDFSSSHWKRVLKRFAEQRFSDEAIHEILDGELPMLARAYLERERARS